MAQKYANENGASHFHIKKDDLSGVLVPADDDAAGARNAKRPKDNLKTDRGLSRCRCRRSSRRLWV